MASTYTSNLRLELQGSGENSTTWGTKANAVFSQMEDAVSGLVSIDVAGATASFTLTTVNGGTDQARMSMVRLHGLRTANVEIIVPAVTKQYLIVNDTTGDFTLTVKTPAGTGVVVQRNTVHHVFCDATNVRSAADDQKDVLANAISDNYTLALTDRGLSVDFSGGSGKTVTIPANASVNFPIGSVVVLTNNSANSLAIAITTDTLRQAGTTNTGSRTLSAYGQATLRKVTSTVWFISGAGLS